MNMKTLLAGNPYQSFNSYGAYTPQEVNPDQSFALPQTQSYGSFEPSAFGNGTTFPELGNSFGGVIDGIKKGVGDWWSGTPLLPKNLTDSAGNLTGQRSGSILGDFGSLAGYGLQAMNLFGQRSAGKLAEKNFKLQREGLAKNWAATRADALTRIENRDARRLVNDGMSGVDAVRQAEAGAKAKLAGYGL